MEKATDLLSSSQSFFSLKSLKLKTKQQELLLRISILGLVYILAFITRLFSVLRYESMIHEFDPYFNYRTTLYLTQKGFYEFWNWFDSESWYPLGRIIGGTLYPGLMVTAAFIYWILRFLRFAVHIREVCVLTAPFFASNTTLVAYFFGKELWDTGAGLVAAALIAICPGYISRSVAGSYDNEGVAIFALLLTFYLFVKAVKTGSLAWSLGSALGYFYMVSAWGGYVFIINLIPLYVLVLLVVGRYSMRLYVAYNCMYILGMLLAMQIRFVGFQHVQSGEHMAAMGVFFLMQVFYFLDWVKHLLNDQKLFQAFLRITLTCAISVGIIALGVGTASGYISPWTGRFYSLLDPTYAKDHIPIIASVSEHQPTAWSSFMFDFHILLILFPAGLYFCFKRLSDATIFIVMYGLTSMYFAGVMVRLILVATPAVCLISAIAVSATIKNLSLLVRAKTKPTQAGSGKGTTSTKASSKIIGVSDRAEKDEIVKSVMHLKNAEIEDGYTMDAVVSRQNLLMDVRDKLLFEPEYAGNIKERVPPRSSLRIPWAWLSSALCLLQEVGEEKLVLNIGQKALQHPDSKPYVHDILLSMALAECAIAKVGFEKNRISQGFEALARAQCLLRSKVSLGKMTLLSQIEESLEELAPACTLELLGLPRTPENAERRLGAIAALRELLRQGLDVEASCQVQDWQCFLNQALNKLMASEIVELLQWDNLALTRKNKKSIESQNQRVVIDFNCFYVVLLAHIALGFSSKQIDLINKSKIICECLIASEGVDLKFEEAFLLFLLGQGDEAAATEKLRQLELNSDTASRNLASVKETKDVSTVSKPLETWLKDAVLGLFPDTRDCSPSLVNFFRGEKRPFVSRGNKRGLQTASQISHRPLAPAITRDQRATDEPLPYGDTSRHLGSAVKQLAPLNLQAQLTVDKVNVSNASGMPSVQLKRNLGAGRKVWEIWLGLNSIVEKIIFVVSVGCVIFVSFKLMNMQLWRMQNGSGWWLNTPRMTSSRSWKTDFPQDPSYRQASNRRSGITEKLKKLLPKFTMQIGEHPQASGLQNSFFAAGLSPSATAAYKTPMPIEEAETLIKKWQTVKAEALGPDHNIDGLFDVLDEPMLVQWQALSEAAKTRSCFWRFVLLQLSVLRAEILTDGIGQEMAEIEAILEEAAELVDESQLKNPNYYSTYKIRYVLKRQDGGAWRFSEGHILTES